MKLNKYSLTNKNIIDNVCIVETPPRVNQPEPDVIITKRKADYYYPPLECKDTLVWCWISHHYGVQEYEINKNNLYNYEINRKFEYVSCIRNNKLLLKSLKLNRTKLEECLLDDDGIGLGLFVFICFCFKPPPPQILQFPIFSPIFWNFMRLFFGIPIFPPFFWNFIYSWSKANRTFIDKCDSSM